MSCTTGTRIDQQNQEDTHVLHKQDKWVDSIDYEYCLAIGKRPVLVLGPGLVVTKHWEICGGGALNCFVGMPSPERRNRGLIIIIIIIIIINQPQGFSMNDDHQQMWRSAVLALLLHGSI